MKRLANLVGRNKNGEGQGYPTTPPEDAYQVDACSAAADHCSQSEVCSLPAFDSLYEDLYVTPESALSYKKEPGTEQSPGFSNLLSPYDQASPFMYAEDDYDVYNYDGVDPPKRLASPASEAPYTPQMRGLTCEVPDLTHSPIAHTPSWSTPESQKARFVTPSASSESNEDVVLLRQQLRDAQQVIKAVLGTDHIDRYDANKAVRKVAASQKQMADLEKDYKIMHAQRQELETLFSEACLERNQQSMQNQSLELKLDQQSYQASKLDEERRELRNSLAVHTGGDEVPVTEIKHDASLEIQLSRMQELLDQRQSELVKLQLELAKVKELESLTSDQQHALEEMQHLKSDLERAHCEIDELEQERQLNMTEIVDLHKQLRHVQGTGGVKVCDDEYKAMAGKFKESQARVKQLEQERLVLATKTAELKFHLDESESKLANYMDMSEDEHLVRILVLEKQLEGQHKQAKDTLATKCEELRSLRSEMQDRQLDADKWELKANAQEGRILKMACHISDKHKAQKSLILENEELISKLHEFEAKATTLGDTYEQNISGIKALNRKSARRIIELEDQIGAGQPGKPRQPITPDATTAPPSPSPKEMVAFNSKLRNLTNELETCNDAIDSLSKELGDSHLKESSLQAQITTLKETIAGLEEQKEAKIEAAKSVGRRTDEESLDLDMKLRASKWTITKLQSQLGETSIAIESKKHELDKEQRANAAETERLTRELEESQAQVSVLENQFKRFLRKDSSSQIDEPDKPEKPPLDVNPDLDLLRSQLTEKDEQLRLKEEAYTMQADQVSALREQLQEAQMSVESMEYERNFSAAKAEELGKLAKMDNEDLIAEKLRQKAVQCAELEIMLQKAEDGVAESSSKIEKLELERGFNQTKIKELSSIWEDHLKADAIQAEQKAQIDAAARKVVEGQEKLQQLELEKDGSVAKATSLSLKLAESMQRVDELSESLAMERQANQQKLRMLAASGINVGEHEDDSSTSPRFQNNRFRSFMMKGMRKTNSSHSFPSPTPSMPTDEGSVDVGFRVEEEEENFVTGHETEGKELPAICTATKDADKAAGTEECTRPEGEMGCEYEDEEEADIRSFDDDASLTDAHELDEAGLVDVHLPPTGPDATADFSLQLQMALL